MSKVQNGQSTINPCEILRRFENGCAFKGAERNEILVPGYDAVGIPRECGIEKFVVLGIAANKKRSPWCHDFAVTHQNDGRALTCLGGNIPVKLLAGDHLEQFVASRGREDKGAVPGKEIEKFSRNGARQKDAADYGVGIDDNALTGWHRPCA